VDRPTEGNRMTQKKTRSAGPAEKKSPTTTTAPTAPTEAAVEATLRRLEVVRRRAYRSNLEMRFELGKHLNDLLGPPTTRQEYGEGVLKKASERLGLSVPTLSRYRNFANQYKTLKAVQALGDRPWEEIREELVRRPRREEATSALTPVLKALGRATQVLTQAVIDGQADEEKEAVRQALCGLAQAVQEKLGIEVSVGLVADGPRKGRRK